MNPRQRVVRYLQQITHDKPIEQQLRDQWLRELADLQDQDHAAQHQAQLDHQQEITHGG